MLKTLRNDLPDEDHDKGIADLAIEAEFLSIFAHPNIISMKAMSQSDPRRSRYFVVLDYLPTTLDLKIKLWRRVVGENTGYWVPCYGYCFSNSIVLHINWKERLRSAADIASALQYLHERNIIYRDVKPDNIGTSLFLLVSRNHLFVSQVAGNHFLIGYDSQGQLKLFDFGLSKRLDTVQKDKENEENYLLTGNTGSLRYMAPEVARREPYNTKADSYSFGVLFWQICSLAKPYVFLNERTHAQQVVQHGLRPNPDKSWPYSWIALMTTAWDVNPSKRPNMNEIVQQLQISIEDMSMEDNVIPSRASEIRAKKKRKKVSRDNRILDVDTRLAEVTTTNKLQVQSNTSEII